MSDASAPKGTPAGLLEYLTQVSEFSDVAFWLADPHRPAILFMSRAYERLWGRSLEELQANPRAYQDAVHPDDHVIVRASRERLLNGQVIDIEYRVVLPEGGLRWIRTRGVPIRDASGHVHRTVGVNEDITPMRAALEAERAFARALDEASVAGVAAVDAAGVQTYVNSAFCRMVGWSKEALLGKTPPFVYWAPESLPALQNAFDQALRGESPKNGHVLRFLRRSGERFDVQLLLAPLKSASGDITGWVASAHDITELKRAEERLRRNQDLLQEAQRLAHLGSWEWDIPTNRVQWSDELYRIYGLDAASVPASYEAYLQALHPEDADLANDVIQSALASRSPFEFEHRVRRPNGEVRYLFAQGDVVCDASGTPLRMVGTAHDITERKQADEARFKLHQERAARLVAEEGLRTREEFLSVAAHELRTPLTALKLQVQTFRRAETGQATDSTLSARLDKLDRQVDRMDRLVNTLLDVSRSLAGRMDLEPERVDLSALVADLVERQSALAERSGCPVHVRKQDGASDSGGSPSQIHGQWDRIRLEQAIENLFLNALKYGAGKPVEVILSRNERTARVAVRDEGIGIAPEDQLRIFERFERAVSVKNFGGFGLGLWITRQIIEAHGGTIRVESHLGKGATFMLELPLEPVRPSTVSDAKLG